MIRILIINTNGLYFEGVTNSIVSYLEAMDRTDLEIDFAFGSKSFEAGAVKIIKELGCNIYELPSRSKNTLCYFLGLFSLIKKNYYNIVHTHGNSATLAIEMWAAKLAGCRVRIAHSRNTCTDYPLIDKLLRPLFNVSYTHGFACGVEAGKWLFSNKSFQVIPNGKEIEKFAFNQNKRIQMRQQLELTDHIVIGHVGNFNYQKNHEFLIRIFKELSAKDERYRLYLMGDGELRPHVEQMVEEYKLKHKVIFTGYVSNVADMLQAMDIMVLPSRFEGLPNVVVEWQIACLPCVISDVITRECKLTDLVSYLSLQDGPAAWADKIHSFKVIDRENIKDSILKQIRAAGFDIRKNAKQLKGIYYELVSKQVGQRNGKCIEIATTGTGDK